MGEHGWGLAFDRAAVEKRAARVSDAGECVPSEAAALVAALDEASAAAVGLAGALPSGLMSGAALAECAALLARRASDSAAETRRIAEAMMSSAALLADTDAEVAGRVSGAAS